MSSGWGLFSDSENSHHTEHEPMEEDETEDEPISKPSGKGKTFHITEGLVEYMCGKPFLTMNRVHNYLRENCAERISRGASAALIGVTQSVLIDLFRDIEIAMQTNKSKRISPKIISMTIRNDSELSTLFSNVSIPKSGMYGNIHHTQSDSSDTDADDIVDAADDTGTNSSSSE